MTNRAQGGAKAFVREVKTGLTILGILCVVLIFVAYRRFTGTTDIPPAIIDSSDNSTVHGTDGAEPPDRPPTILRAEPSDGSVESPSLQGFRPAEIRKSLEDTSSGSVAPTPPPASLIPKANIAEPETKAIDDDAPRIIQVRANDSFWSISERAYGTGVYFRALYEHNRLRFPEPDRLPEGGSVVIPALTELRNRYPRLCPSGGATQ